MKEHPVERLQSQPEQGGGEAGGHLIQRGVAERLIATGKCRPRRMVCKGFLQRLDQRGLRQYAGFDIKLQPFRRRINNPGNRSLDTDFGGVGPKIAGSGFGAVHYVISSLASHTTKLRLQSITDLDRVQHLRLSWRLQAIRFP